MNKLINLQNQFIDGIYNVKNDCILSSIKNGKASKLELLGIYQNNLVGNLTNALRITYPKIFHFLKEKNFNKIAFEFISSNRSQSGNLDDYGENFHEILFAKKEYFLSDLAKIEWLRQKAFLSKDVVRIDLEKLKSLSEEELLLTKFKVHPSFNLLTSNYNLISQKKQNKPLKNSVHFLIYRHDLELKTERISKNERIFFDEIMNGITLDAIYRKYDFDIGLYLSKHLANGVITRFTSKHFSN